MRNFIEGTNWPLLIAILVIGTLAVIGAQSIGIELPSWGEERF